MISAQEREEQRKERWKYWVEELESEAARIEMLGVWVMAGGIGLGVVADWLFDWKFLYYSAVAIGGLCWLDAFLVKYPEAKRRRFFLSGLTPLEDAIDRVEQRLADIEKLQGFGKRS